MNIDARQIVGAGFPTAEGEVLAADLLSRNLDSWADLTIDVSSCTPALLISAFYNSFLQKIFEETPARLEEARRIRWLTKFEFQQKNKNDWVKAFKPVPKNGVLGA